jgi:choline dehydrogenase-like flavoprotein
MNFKEDDFDVIIVGSGPGGATVAKELAIKNSKVLILEWGDYQPLRGSFAQGCKAIFTPGKGLLYTP